MSDTISSNTTGQDLSSVALNPVIVDPGVTIQGTLGTIGYGIATTVDAAWTVVNYGTVIGRVAGSDLSDGILLDETGGGTVTNQMGAYIYGKRSGVYSTGPTNLINNGGAIIGSTDAGVVLRSGGAIINQSGGYIFGSVFGVNVTGMATVDNAGTISATRTTQSAAVAMDGGGYFINRPSAYIHSTYIGLSITNAASSGASGTVINKGVIYGRAVAIQIVDASGIVTNSGSIGGGTTSASGISLKSIGVLLDGGGSVDNTGIVNGSDYGININNGFGTVYTSGVVSSSQMEYGAGIALQSGGILTNASGGYIRSPWKGVQLGNNLTESIGGTIINQGVILAAAPQGDGADDLIHGEGVWIHGSGLIVNGPTGLISGGAFGIVAYYNTTVVNHGTVLGTEYAFKNVNANSANLIIMYPGAKFSGIVDANDTIGSVTSTLELASGSSTGTLSGFGTQYWDFTDLQIDSGAAWDIGGTVVAGQTIVMAGTDDILILENPQAMNGSLSGFTTGDTVILVGVTDTTGFSLSSSDVLTIDRANNSDLAFELTDVGGVSLTTIEGYAAIVACFAAGTRIATPHGPALVEALCPGNEVLTASGMTRPVLWIGHRTVDCRRHPEPDRVWPIRVARHAFGMNRPSRSLTLSPDHAVFVDEVLIPIKLLINGATIRQIHSLRVTYYHLELSSHDVVLAEGLPCESYLETGSRSSFENSCQVVDLHPDFVGSDEARVGAIWQEKGYAPLVGSAEILECVRARLAFQAAMLGYREDGSLPRRLRGA